MIVLFPILEVVAATATTATGSLYLLHMYIPFRLNFHPLFSGSNVKRWRRAQVRDNFSSSIRSHYLAIIQCPSTFAKSGSGLPPSKINRHFWNLDYHTKETSSTGMSSVSWDRRTEAKDAGVSVRLRASGSHWYKDENSCSRIRPSLTSRKTCPAVTLSTTTCIGASKRRSGGKREVSSIRQSVATLPVNDILLELMIK